VNQSLEKGILFVKLFSAGLFNSLGVFFKYILIIIYLINSVINVNVRINLITQCFNRGQVTSL